MFNFLKNLLKVKPGKEDISIEQLQQWFKDKTEPIYSNFNAQLKEVFDRIPEQINAIKTNITNLENANIKDEKKIEPKVKQVVLGNRVNYIRILSQFIDGIEIPSNINYESSIEFCSQITKRLDELSKSTGKSFYTVQHLFPDHVERIAKDIKNLDKAVRSIKAVIEKNKIVRIEDVKVNIQKLIKSIDKKDKLKKELEEAKKHLEKSKLLKQEVENKIIELKNSTEYNNLNNLKQEKDDINIKIRSIENQIIELFSPLEAALKKFQRIILENEELVGRYATNPVKAFLEDKDLKIITLLQKMKNSILSNNIDLRDKKREKILEKIGQIKEEQLKQILLEYEKSKEREKDIKNKISMSRIIPLLEEMKYKLEHHTQMIEKIKSDIFKLEKEIEKININKIKQELQNKIKELINVELDIKLPFSNP